MNGNAIIPAAKSMSTCQAQLSLYPSKLLTTPKISWPGRQGENSLSSQVMALF